MKKVLSILMLAILTLTGCTASSSASGSDREILSPKSFTEPVEIKFWHAMSGEQEASLKKLTQEYNASQDKVVVKLEAQGTYQDLQTKLSAAVSSDTVPTMAMGYSNWMVEYDSKDFLIDLTPYYENEEVGIDKANYVDAFIEENNFDGRYLGMPFNKSTEVIYYNKDLLSEAGVEVPTTHEEMLEASKTVFEKTGVVGMGYDALNNYLAISLKECDIQGWTDDNGKSLINDPCIVKQVQEYQDGVNDGYMRVAGEDGYLSGPFGSGTLAMNVGSIAGSSFVEQSVDGKFEYGVAPYPSEFAPQQGTNLMVFNSSKTSDEQVSAAWDYMKFLTSDASTTQWAIDTGYLPVTKSAYETEEFKAHMQTSEVAKVSYEQMDRMEILSPVFEGSNEIFTTDFIDFMTKSVTPGTDIQVELDTLSQKIEKAYEESQE